MKLYNAILAVDRYDQLLEGRYFIHQHRCLVLAGEASISIELQTLNALAFYGTLIRGYSQPKDLPEMY